MIQDSGFNLEKSIKVLQQYSSSTGMSAVLIDDSGKTLYKSYQKYDFCKICKELRSESNQNINCSSVHLYGSYQAERFGGKYVFFCPMGMVHWASPITIDGIMTAAIIGGPVNMMEPDEFLLAELFGKYLKDEQLSRAIAFSKSIPVVGTERVNSLSELLRILTAYLSDSTWYRMELELEEQKQAADISAYIHYLKSIAGSSNEIPSYPIEKERDLLNAIALGDKPLARKLLNEILGHVFFSSGNDFETVRSRVLELVVLLSRASLEGGADVKRIFGMSYQYLNQLKKFKSLDELTPWLSRIMERFTEQVFNMTNIKRKDVIYKSIEYIRRNYMTKISLDEVASYVYLSPTYFSKIFKEETGMNFNTYLNNVRIDVSKKLLADSSVNMVDISNIVGFEDQSYFSKVFKKITGQTPKKYRESRGKNNP
ncbi:MAG: AraC family transcriptional regulator [Clostridiaceae bacterium]|jgi:two-component system response regulator YesN|nr:AraC family transcriptional regulator [Clostridiaceae bacterium]